MLTADDPNAPVNLIGYSYKDGQYKEYPQSNLTHLAVHFTMEGCALHKDYPEAKEQAEDQERLKEEEAARLREGKEAGEEAEVEEDAQVGLDGADGCVLFAF